MTDKIICITKLQAILNTFMLIIVLKFLENINQADMLIYLLNTERKRQVSKTKHRIMKENPIS